MWRETNGLFDFGQEEKEKQTLLYINRRKARPCIDTGVLHHTSTRTHEHTYASPHGLITVVLMPDVAKKISPCSFQKRSPPPSNGSGKRWVVPIDEIKTTCLSATLEA